MSVVKRRVLTYLKSSVSQTTAQPGQFGQCIVTTLLTDKNTKEDNKLQVKVHCELSRQGLVLQKADNDNVTEKNRPNVVLLRHPPLCPMLHLTPDIKAKISNDSEKINSGVSVAVAVILESSDQKVLITRRPPHMRTFPNVWVPPGGGSEDQESVIVTGLREVFEETGLDIKDDIKLVEPLCLWESVYPPLLAKGEPKRHTMVLYLHIQVNRTSKQLQSEVKLDPIETNACAWLNLAEVNIATNVDVPLNFTDTFKVHQLDQDNILRTVDKLSHVVLRSEVPPIGAEDVERISTGTRFALEQYYDKTITIQSSTILNPNPPNLQM
jgi:8-oxo-dGTP pyrophosphatase MutT (NUDIX family)